MKGSCRFVLFSSFLRVVLATDFNQTHELDFAKGHYRILDETCERSNEKSDHQNGVRCVSSS